MVNSLGSASFFFIVSAVDMTYFVTSRKHFAKRLVDARHVSGALAMQIEDCSIRNTRRAQFAYGCTSCSSRLDSVFADQTSIAGREPGFAYTVIFLLPKIRQDRIVKDF